MARRSTRPTLEIARKESLRLYAAVKRALAVVSAVYEWRALSKGRKQPFAIYRRDGAPLILAALGEGEGVAIVTAPSSGIVVKLHHRMPIVLEREALRAWLDPADRATALLKDASAEALTMHAVSNDVSDVRKNHPGLLDRVDELAVGPEPEQLQLLVDDRVR